MKLRKERKAPLRFDEEDHDQGNATYPTSITSARPNIRIRPHNAAYNPNLRPSSFPTLEYGVPIISDPNTIRSSKGTSSKSLVLNTKIRVKMERFQNPRQDCQKPRAKIVIPPLYETPPGIQAGSIQDRLLKMKTQRIQAEINWNYNGPGSEVYAQNMEILYQMAERTDDDWNFAEMMTSDEEDSPLVKAIQLKKVRYAISMIIYILTGQSTRTAMASLMWDDLSAPHQVDLVCVMSEIYHTREEAMQQLRISPTQRQRMLKLLDYPNKLESDEWIGMADFQAETNRFMRTWGPDEDETSLLASVYGTELLQRYLPGADLETCMFSTTTELAKAKTYLESCGHQAGLLDHWKSLLDDYDGNHAENGRKSPPSQPLIYEAETRRPVYFSEPESRKVEDNFTPGPWLTREPIPFYQTCLYNHTDISENVPSGQGLGLPGTGSRITSSNRPVWQQTERFEPSGPADSGPASNGPSKIFLQVPNVVYRTPSSRTMNPSTSFLYHVSANISPTLQPAKLDKRRVTPYQPPIPHSPSMLRNSQKPMIPRRQSLRPADTTTRPDDVRDGPCGSGAAIKKKRSTGPRKKRAVSSSTYLTTDTTVDNNVPPTASTPRELTQVSTAPAPSPDPVPITENGSAKCVEAGAG